jgi:uncharacterized protein YhdP
LSGQVDLSEKGGELTLDGAAASLSLPAVFPEPDIALDCAEGAGDWKSPSWHRHQACTSWSLPARMRPVRPRAAIATPATARAKST